MGGIDRVTILFACDRGRHGVVTETAGAGVARGIRQGQGQRCWPRAIVFEHQVSVGIDAGGSALVGRIDGGHKIMYCGRGGDS